MHSKLKGNIGQFYVSAKLAEMGYSVFTEEGDLSKIDIIAEKGGKLIRIQVKATFPAKGRVGLRLQKSGPGYRYRYDPELFDYFALVDLKSTHVYLIESAVLKQNGATFSLRVAKAQNNQSKRINSAEDYLLEKVLRNEQEV